MLKLLNDIKSVSPDSNITIYDDDTADHGFMFTKNGSNAFDLIRTSRICHTKRVR